MIILIAIVSSNLFLHIFSESKILPQNPKAYYRGTLKFYLDEIFQNRMHSSSLELSGNNWADFQAPIFKGKIKHILYSLRLNETMKIDICSFEKYHIYIFPSFLAGYLLKCEKTFITFYEMTPDIFQNSFLQVTIEHRYKFLSNNIKIDINRIQPKDMKDILNEDKIIMETTNIEPHNNYIVPIKLNNFPNIIWYEFIMCSYLTKCIKEKIINSQAVIETAHFMVKFDENAIVASGNLFEMIDYTLGVSFNLNDNKLISMTTLIKAKNYITFLECDHSDIKFYIDLSVKKVDIYSWDGEEEYLIGNCTLVHFSCTYYNNYIFNSITLSGMTFHNECPDATYIYFTVTIEDNSQEFTFRNSDFILIRSLMCSIPMIKEVEKITMNKTTSRNVKTKTEANHKRLKLGLVLSITTVLATIFSIAFFWLFIYIKITNITSNQ